MKSKTIESFFKRKSTKTTQSPSEASQIEVPPSSFVLLNSDARPSKISRVEDEALDLSNLEREPGLRKQIYEYPINMRDEIRIAYIKAGPYQHILSEYLVSNSKQHSRYFNHHDLNNFTVFCLPFFLFNNNPSSCFESIAFTHNGFSNWKKYRCCSMVVISRCAFRGHDESSGSKNCGNFLELLSLLASYDEKVEDVLKIAPQNAKIGDRKFSIIKMANIFRFVDKQGQNVIFNVLLQHSFDIQNIQGQGYDGASNMRGEFNGLQALILNDYRYAFYVHCFAHQMVEVYQLFKDLYDIVNIASASSKQHNELQKAQAVEITHLVSINELATGTGMNQIDTLQRPGETRWSFHFNSITSLLKMYNATSTVLENLKNTTSNYSQQGDAHNTYNRLRSFEFIFILHMMKEVLGVTDNLCQALQCHSQDTLNDMSLVLTTKDLIQKLRDDGWNEYLVDSGKSTMYPLVDRLIRLILTLSVSTTSSKRAFSAMKIVKTQLRSKMEDDFLRSSLVVYIEKEIAEKFNINEIIDDFSEVKDRRVQFK
ncbi:hypothetical protein V6Z12_D06G165100 [Gossypium hirsutum]